MNLSHGTIGLPPNSFYDDFAVILCSNWESLFVGLKKYKKVQVNSGI